jgi:hypothetical protein
MPGDIYIATASFVAAVDGKRVTVRRDITRVREGHPLLKRREHMFRLIDAHYEVEQATKAPGEKRGDSPTKTYPHHVGAGWFETPDGERHRGREAAQAHMEGD